MTAALLKNKLALRGGGFMAAVLLIQPPLDVLSYFIGGGAFTTVLRVVLLAAVTLHGFLLSDKKWAYAAMLSAAAGFWLLHVLNAVRVGYEDPLTDLSAYLKILQCPLWTMAFLTLFRHCEGLEERILTALAADFALILLIIGLSYLVGLPVHTYEYPERDIRIGVLGWFLHGNAQSAILSMLLPALLLWALHREKLWLFCLSCLAGFGLFYLTGTRFTYYGGILIAALFLAFLLFSRKKLLYCLPLAAAILLFIALRGASPMAARQQVSVDSFTLYQGKIDEIMGEDKDFVCTEGEEIPPAVLEKMERVYTEIYGGKGVFGETLYERMIGEFGLQRTMQQMGYSIRPQVLNNARTRKLRYMELVWGEQDFLTRLVGMDLVYGNTFDPENDFPSLLYYYGYLGFGLYCAFFACILGRCIFVFFRRFPSLLRLEFAAPAAMAAMALGAAWFSGWVFRWPNVTVYLSLACAMLIFLADNAPMPARLRPGHERNPAVQVKKIT